MPRILILISVALSTIHILGSGPLGPTATRSAKSTIDPNAPDTLVICPRKFQTALQPWLDYRQNQGHRIQVVSPAFNSRRIKQQIKTVAERGRLEHVVIIGDSGDRNAEPDSLVVTDYVAAKVNVLFGSEPEIATDNTYADLDEDGVPELAIGRLPVDSVQELKQAIERIIEYEREPMAETLPAAGKSAASKAVDWQRRLNFIAGVGGFGQVIDGLIEQTTKQMITDLVPTAFQTSMTYGSWNSPYCPDPRRFSESAIERFNEGCLFWVYIGHGSRDRLDQVHMPDRSHSILELDSVPKLNCRNGSPIAIFLACYTGATDHEHDCLAETMFRQKRGPIAAICGTRITMPYAMSLLSLEMMHEYFSGESLTLGQLTMLAKQRMVQGSDHHPAYREMIEGMGKAFSPLPQLLDSERLEHVDLIHLMGDPLLRVKRPRSIKLAVAEQGVAGETVKVTGVAPGTGELTLELAYRRDRLRERRPSRRKFDPSDAALSAYQVTYEKALDSTCNAQTISVTAGPFETELLVPAGANGACVLRGRLQTSQGLAIGAQPIEISKQPQ